MNFYSLIPIIITIISFVVMKKKCQGFIKNWISGSRPLISIHYLFPTIFGILLGNYIFQKPVNYLDGFLLICSVFFSFQTSVIVNDINDIKTDKIALKKSLLNSNYFGLKVYQNLGGYFFILSLLFALVIEYRILLIVLLGHILHFTYSSKPFRLKRFFPVSILMLALGALLSAISGYALFESSKPFLSFPIKPALFIVIPLFLALNFRDLADYRGDEKTDVTTLFTLFGLGKGRLINAFLVLLGYLSVPLILKFPPLFFAVVPLGILSFYFCLKKPFKEKYIFYIYFILIAILLIIFKLNPEIYLGPVF